MNTNPRLPALLPILAIVLSASTLCAADIATIPDLAGQWHGQSRFTGISYAEATQKQVAAQQVELVLRISTDGKVTGRFGGAELTNCVVEENRGWLGRLLHLKTDFLIRGQISGPVAPGSESGTHPINAPFNVTDARIGGTVFVVYPVKYPYPFLSLKLGRKQ